MGKQIRQGDILLEAVSIEMPDGLTSTQSLILTEMGSGMSGYPAVSELSATRNTVPLEELAQKMYNESGGQGNLYRQEPGIVRRYENGEE